jgi:transcriptional regulator with XRE-family HTH domain
MISKTIKRLYSSLGLTQLEFARKLGFTHAAISHLESGKSKQPSRGLIAAICNLYWPGHGYVNREWLLTGEGEMFLSTADDKLLVEVTEEEAAHLQRFHELELANPAEAKALNDYLEYLLQKAKKEPDLLQKTDSGILSHK